MSKTIHADDVRRTLCQISDAHAEIESILPILQAAKIHAPLSVCSAMGRALGKLKHARATLAANAVSSLEVVP